MGKGPEVSQTHGPQGGLTITSDIIIIITPDGEAHRPSCGFGGLHPLPQIVYLIKHNVSFAPTFANDGHVNLFVGTWPLN